MMIMMIVMLLLLMLMLMMMIKVMMMVIVMVMMMMVRMMGMIMMIFFFYQCYHDSKYCYQLKHLIFFSWQTNYFKSISISYYLWNGCHDHESTGSTMRYLCENAHIRLLLQYFEIEKNVLFSIIILIIFLLSSWRQTSNKYCLGTTIDMKRSCRCNSDIYC